MKKLTVCWWFIMYYRFSFYRQLYLIRQLTLNTFMYDRSFLEYSNNFSFSSSIITGRDKTELSLIFLTYAEYQCRWMQINEEKLLVIFMIWIKYVYIHLESKWRICYKFLNYTSLIIIVLMYLTFWVLF